METLIEARHACLRFSAPTEKRSSLKKWVLDAVRGRMHRRTFLALDDVSFRIARGESVGLVGRNGAGKSTLLKLVTGIADPEPMKQYVSRFCEVSTIHFADHHRFTAADIRRIRRAYVQINSARKLILTTEKDAARLRELVDHEVMSGLPIYYLPIEVRIHQNNDMSFDQTVKTIVHDNNLFQERMRNAKFDF